jgi:ketosteroid isomerase-like protein
MSQENVVRGARYPISLPSERAAQRRTLDESLYVRFPGLLLRVGQAWMGLPPSSRFRRLMLTRLIQRGCAAANRRDFDLLMCGFDPAIELELPESLAGGFLPPDLLGVHRGHESYRRMWESLIEAWPDLKLKPEEVMDFGEGLLSAVRLTAHGRHSGIPLEQPIFQVFTMRRGLMIRQQDFADRQQALKAAGISE